MVLKYTLCSGLFKYFLQISLELLGLTYLFKDIDRFLSFEIRKNVLTFRPQSRPRLLHNFFVDNSLCTAL